ncbi:hypothetical protein ASB57_28895 [Bordetella sp. N]|nr:hypothetical protein ASB57_28895 [Bordetella sp. N]
MGAIPEPGRPDEHIVSQDQRRIEERPPATRTHADNKSDRDEAGLALGIDVYMNRQLIVSGTFLSALSASDSFEEATRKTKAFLADSKLEALRHAKAADSASAAQAAGKAGALGAAESVLAENCMNGDTLTIYRRYAPKQG